MCAFITNNSPLVYTPSCTSVRQRQWSVVSQLPAIDNNSIMTYANEGTTTFEPILPDTTTLVGFGIIVILSIIASFVWANQVVPVSRTKLALSKRDGEVKRYLDELKEGSISNAVQNEMINDSLLENDAKDKMKTADTTTTTTTIEVKPNVGDGRDLERWLFSDWLNKNKQPKDPAIPFVLKKAKWNSGDNPVLVTSALLFVGVLIGSITDRVASL